MFTWTEHSYTCDDEVNGLLFCSFVGTFKKKRGGFGEDRSWNTGIGFFPFSFLGTELWQQVVLLCLWLPWNYWRRLLKSVPTSSHVCLGQWQWIAVSSWKCPISLSIHHEVMERLLRGSFSVAYDEWMKNVLGCKSVSSPHIQIQHQAHGVPLGRYWMNEWYKLNWPKLSGILFLPNLSTLPSRIPLLG